MSPTASKLLNQVESLSEKDRADIVSNVKQSLSQEYAELVDSGLIESNRRSKDKSDPSKWTSLKEHTKDMNSIRQELLGKIQKEAV